jgi:Replication initiator protein, pSAM2
VTEPTRVGELLPGVLGEVVDRAGHGYDRWAELVAQAGYCHHPIRLAGRVEHADRQTGEVRPVYDSEREPDGVLLKACGTRRESRCPSCAATYRADAYQLLAAGLRGGKGVPETISEHPRLFVTFTAPSFGQVHTRKAQGRLVLPCHPHRHGARCPHGLRDGCWHRHDEDDPRLGEPLCPSCYDARAQVLWNALAPELWRRTTIAVQRALGRLVGLQEGELRRLVRISYAKVAEFQRRGAIHFHAVIRLDAATDCRCPGCLAPPPEGFTPALLEDALQQAVPAVGVPCPPVDGGPDRYARWGEQLDVRNITRDSDQAGELSAEQVAGYIAKYATKLPRASARASTGALAPTT